MIDRRRLAALAASSVLAPLLGGRSAAAQTASAQGWPSRVVKLVKDSVNAWVDDNASSMGAALACA